jgi:hypothetical protein
MTAGSPRTRGYIVPARGEAPKRPICRRFACRRRDSNPRHADYDSGAPWLYRAKTGPGGHKRGHVCTARLRPIPRVLADAARDERSTLTEVPPPGKRGSPHRAPRTTPPKRNRKCLGGSAHALRTRTLFAASFPLALGLAPTRQYRAGYRAADVAHQPRVVSASPRARPCRVCRGPCCAQRRAQHPRA